MSDKPFDVPTATKPLLRQIGIAIVLSLLLFAVIAASIWLASRQQNSGGGSRSRIAADRAWQREDWQAAEKYYDEVLARDPFNPIAQFRKSYALHEQLNEALEGRDSGAAPTQVHWRMAQAALNAYEHTLDHLSLQKLAYYNIACIQARMGRTEDALDAITRSVELGMSGSQLQSDADFESIRDEPRFQRLIGQNANPDSAGLEMR